MKRELFSSMLILSLAGAAQGQTIPLALKEAIRMGVERNLDVRAELYNPAAAEADLRKNRGIYDTHLTLLTNFQYSTTQSASSVLTGTTLSRQKTFRLNPGVNRLLPSGGTVALVNNNTWNSNNSTVTLDNYWQSDLTLSLAQPLLKNFGRETTELNISVAVNAKEGALERFRARLNDTVAQVRTEYFKLRSLREDLEVRKTSLALSRKILADTQGRVKAGVLPAMEILNAEFGVASREKEVIDAEKAVSDQNDLLRALLRMQGSEDLDPVDRPDSGELAVDGKAALQRALGERPELKEARSNLKSSELQARVAEQRTRPDLNLTSALSLTGLDKTYNRDLEKIASADYPVWSIGLQLDYPLGNSAAENDLARSRIKHEQAGVQLRSLEQNVENEVKIAIRAVATAFKQLEVTGRGRAYAEERLRSFIKKSEAGLATTKDVLDVENDLVVARGNEIKALVAYDEARNRLWRATGELLEKSGVKVDSKDADDLYEKLRR